AELDRHAQPPPQLLADRIRALPAREVPRLAHDARLLVDRARGADADAAELARIDARLLGGLAQRALERGHDVLGAAGGRRGVAGLLLDLVAGVHHDGLDLRAAEVDAPAELRARGRHLRSLSSPAVAVML